MISLRPSLITEHHSVSSLNDLAREASPSSRYLRPARDEDTTYTVGGNCSRVDGDKRTDNIETRSYSPDASVDVTDARNSNFSFRDRPLQPLKHPFGLLSAFGLRQNSGRLYRLRCRFRPSNRGICGSSYEADSISG